MDSVWFAVLMELEEELAVELTAVLETALELLEVVDVVITVDVVEETEEEEEEGAVVVDDDEGTVVDVLVVVVEVAVSA